MDTCHRGEIDQQRSLDGKGMRTVQQQANSQGYPSLHFIDKAEAQRG